MSKWTTGEPQPGPRQVKAVNDAIKKMAWEGKGVKEITGIHGKPETQRSSIATLVFGGQLSPTAIRVMQEVGDKFAWTVTRNNANDVVNAAQAALVEIQANPVIEDKRITQEEHDANQRRMNEYAQKSEAKAKAHKEQVAAAVTQLRAKYPWAESIAAKGLSNQARAAACIKYELALAFPGIEFSVRSSSFAGGDDVRVHWTLGPTAAEVEQITGKYSDGHFDGSDDSFKYDHSVEGDAVDQVLGRAKYVNESRDYPQDFREKLKAALMELNGNDQAAVERDLSPVMQALSFKYGEEFVGLTRSESGDYVMLKTQASANPPNIPTPAQSQPDAMGTISFNVEKNGIEIRFPTKPSMEIIASLKRNGWRWAFHSKCWYARRSDSALKFAEELIGAVPASV